MITVGRSSSCQVGGCCSGLSKPAGHLWGCGLTSFTPWVDICGEWASRCTRELTGEAGEGRPRPGCPAVCQGTWVLWGRGRHDSSPEQSSGARQVEGQACAKVPAVGRVASESLSPLLAARACERTLKGWLMELRQVDYRLGSVSARRVAAGPPGLELVGRGPQEERGQA